MEKITKELAEKEFESYCGANRISTDASGEDKKEFEQIKDRFVFACMDNRIEVDGKNLTYIVSDMSESAEKKILVQRPTGNAYIAMDGYKDTQQMHKLQAFCSAMTGEEVKFFSKLDNLDYKFFTGIATLFLAE